MPLYRNPGRSHGATAEGPLRRSPARPQSPPPACVALAHKIEAALRALPMPLPLARLHLHVIAQIRVKHVTQHRMHIALHEGEYPALCSALSTVRSGGATHSTAELPRLSSTV